MYDGIADHSKLSKSRSLGCKAHEERIVFLADNKKIGK